MAPIPDKIMLDSDDGSVSPDSLQDNFNEVTVLLEYFNHLVFG